MLRCLRFLTVLWSGELRTVGDYRRTWHHTPGFRCREGFTLLELMIVTVILGILALIAASALTGVRERAMIAAATTDMRNAAHAVELYITINGAWPENPDKLEEVGFRNSPDVRFCSYDLSTGSNGSATSVRMQMAHRGAETLLVTTEHPVWGGRIDVEEGECAGVDSEPEPEDPPWFCRFFPFLPGC